MEEGEAAVATAVEEAPAEPAAEEEEAAVSASASASASGASASGASGTPIEVRVVYAKNNYTLSIDADATVAQLKTLIAQASGCPEENMKLMFKGLLASPDKPELDLATLRAKGVVTRSKVLVVGATAAQIMDAVAAEAGAKGQRFADETKGPATKEGPWATMTEHKKTLEKGKPTDAMFAYRPGHEELPAEPLAVYGSLLMKVRLTFRLDEGVLIINTKERTQRVPLSSIQGVTSQSIPSHEEYHTVCFKMGKTDKSNFFVYWVPSQYVSAIKGSVSLSLGDF